MLSKKWKKILLAALFLHVCAATPAFAASGNTLAFDWHPEILTTKDTSDNLMGNNAADPVRQQIEQALTSKMHQLSNAGKLPFKVTFGQTTKLDRIQDTLGGDAPLGIVPIMTLDESFDKSYQIGGKTYYATIIASSLSLAICQAGTADDPGLQIIGVVPMSGYVGIGTDEQGPTNQPLTHAEKAKVFGALNQKMIEDQMTFDSLKKILRNYQQGKTSFEVYQVNAVNISSNKARTQIFGDARSQDKIKKLIANTFTATYQHDSGHLMFPPSLMQNLNNDAQKHLYSFTMNGPSGDVLMKMRQPDHSIKLDFYGVGSADVPTKRPSELRRYTMHKAGLSCTKDNKPSIKNEDTLITWDFCKAGAKVNVSQQNTYAQLLIQMSKKLAKQQVAGDK
ncbi:MAG: hypothetical protein PUB57_06850 [Selenomonadaceae bacterium]|nr:hypothetical protein [Selenomonadaceae bacterium]